VKNGGVKGLVMENLFWAVAFGFTVNGMLPIWIGYTIIHQLDNLLGQLIPHPSGGSNLLGVEFSPDSRSLADRMLDDLHHLGDLGDIKKAIWKLPSN